MAGREKVIAVPTDRDELRAAVDAQAMWWHSIDLGGGVATPGQKGSLEFMRENFRRLRLPPLTGKSVLDIGAFDGFYSFESEREGAARVVASDWFVWALDRRRNPPVHAPDALPGKAPFDLAHAALGSRVEVVVGDYLTTELPVCDVVLYLGVLYHMRHPLASLERLAELTGEVAVIETEAREQVGVREPCWWFYEGAELNDDPTNWWVPNLAGLEAACRAAGFAHVDVVVGPSPLQLRHRGLTHRKYRAVVHARK